MLTAPARKLVTDFESALLALPSDLTFEPGQEGVISLVIRRSEAPHMYPFTVRWVEMNALISVAGAGLIQSLSMGWAVACA